jgi:glycosyltransferase involved in cell wall biosynthesis
VKAKATKNVQILGFQSNDVLKDYMQRANGLIFAAEEDFGLVPLEAQASGTPVIAYGKGGALETVCDLNTPQPTGLFFAHQTIDDICDAVKKFETHRTQFTANHCTENVKKFSAEHFRKKMISFVHEKISVV